MEIKDMMHSDIETRLAEIDDELKQEEITEEKVEELTKEVEDLKAKDDELKKEAEEKRALAKEVSESPKVEIVETRKEEKQMDNIEIRSTKQYMDAWTEVVLKGQGTHEERALLTENATNGTIAVPKYVSDKIWTDWEKSPLLSRVRKVYIKGNYEVGYEVSATSAVIHEEGANAVAEEQLVINYIPFISQYAKKWIAVSKSVMALRGQQFIDYIFDEIGHQLAIAIEKEIVDEAINSNLTAKVTHAIDGDAVLAGLTAMSDEVTAPVAIMSKATYATLRSLRTTAGARLDDVFEGLEVIFNANAGDGVLVLDLDSVEVNFPNGEDFEYNVDNITLMTENKVRILGEIMFSAHLVRMNGGAYVEA